MIANLPMQLATEVKTTDYAPVEGSGEDSSLFSQAMDEAQEKAEEQSDNAGSDTVPHQQSAADETDVKLLTDPEMKQARAAYSEETEGADEAWDTELQELINKFTDASSVEFDMPELLSEENDAVLTEDIGAPRIQSEQSKDGDENIEALLVKHEQPSVGKSINEPESAMVDEAVGKTEMTPRGDAEVVETAVTDGSSRLLTDDGGEESFSGEDVQEPAPAQASKAKPINEMPAQIQPVDEPEQLNMAATAGGEAESKNGNTSTRANSRQQVDNQVVNNLHNSSKAEPSQNLVEVDVESDKSADSIPNLQQVARAQTQTSEQTVYSSQPVDSIKASQETASMQQQARTVGIAEQSQDVRQQVQKKLEMQQEKIAPALGQRLMMMVNSKLQTAEIKLDPPELGSMMVRVQVQNDQAHLHIATQQLQTREMLEQAMPRLREMLQEQGLQLADAQVGSGREQDSNGVAENENGNGGHASGEVADDGDLLEETSIESEYLDVKQGIDYYA